MTYSFMAFKGALKNHRLYANCQKTADCTVAKAHWENLMATQSQATVTQFACKGCSQDNCNPQNKWDDIFSSGMVKGQFITNVGDCTTAKAMKAAQGTEAKFAEGVKQATGTGGKVTATLSTDCARRLSENMAVPFRQLAAGDVKCEYTIVLPLGEDPTAMQNNMTQNSMTATLMNAISAQLQNTPYANVSVSVSGITAVASTPALAPQSPPSEETTDQAFHSQAGFALFVIVLGGLFWW